jgi:hypothetical protein
MLITFHSVNQALFLEAACKERGMVCALIPTPRKLSSSCGYAACVEAEDAPGLIALLRDMNAEWEALWQETEGGWKQISDF